MEIETVNINHVLDIHIPKLTLMVAKRKAEAILICGTVGIGKTYAVESTLVRYKKECPSFRYSIIGGDISKIGLYKALYDNRDELILFDDIDRVLLSDCGDILKNALNTRKERTIAYKKSNRELFSAINMSEAEKEGLYLKSGSKKYPDQFLFNGVCIFISNKKLNEIDNAILDRCIGRIFLDFSIEQIAQRISLLVNNLEPRNTTLPLSDKYEVLQHLYDRAKSQNKYLSIRNFINALSYRAVFPNNDEWKEMIDLYLT